MERSQRTKRNIGLEILRMLLCFYVLLFHCLKQSHSGILNFILSKKFHVPSFFFISFYYLYPIVCLRNVEKMKYRFKRLLIPYTFWIFIFWIIYESSFLFSRNKIKIALNDLKIQLIVGRRIMGHLWFMFNLIFFTIVFCINSFLFEKNNYC